MARFDVLCKSLTLVLVYDVLFIAVRIIHKTSSFLVGKSNSASRLIPAAWENSWCGFQLFYHSIEMSEKWQEQSGNLYQTWQLHTDCHSKLTRSSSFDSYNVSCKLSSSCFSTSLVMTSMARWIDTPNTISFQLQFSSHLIRQESHYCRKIHSVLS